MDLKERLAWLNLHTTELAASADKVEQKFLLKKLIEEATAALGEVNCQVNRQRSIERATMINR